MTGNKNFRVYCKYLFFIRTLFCLCLLSSIFCPSAVWAQEWKEEKGDHFIVYYVNDAVQPKEVLRKAEFCYNKIAEDLGYPRYSNFWQWDKRVKIYIHPTLEAFQTATGQPKWSHGMASYFQKSIHSIEANENFLNSVLPHEITHLIFRDFVGLEGQVPLWMDEGVAQWEEDEKRQMALRAMPRYLRSGNIYTLERLTSMDIRNETNPSAVGLFYLQSISLIDFLIKTYGPSTFTVFCRALRDKKPFEDALRLSYSGSIKTIEELDNKWRKYLLSIPVEEEEE